MRSGCAGLRLGYCGCTVGVRRRDAADDAGAPYGHGLTMPDSEAVVGELAPCCRLHMPPYTVGRS